MQKYLEFIDSYSFDPKMYFRIGKILSDEKYEIQWEGQKQWTYRKVGEADWNKTTTALVLGELEKLDVDLFEFEQAISQRAINQVIFAKHVLAEGEKVFGEEVIKEALRQHDEFFKQFLDIIERIFDNKSTEEKKPKLTIVKD